MGMLRYRDIQWDDIDTSVTKQRMRVGEIIAWSIAGISIVSAAILFIPFDDMRSSADDLVQKYPRTYSWLNRCSYSCEERINASYIDAQKSCGALYGLYNENKNSDLLAWRTALDDRLTFLGCSGFPRLPEHIIETVATAEGEQHEREEQWRNTQEQRIEYEENNQLERYRQSLDQGGLLQFVTSVEAFDEDTLFLTLGSSWFRTKEDRRAQINEVLWQKWATIHSLHAPMKARIKLLNKDGEVVGGSYRDGSHTLWLR